MSIMNRINYIYYSLIVLLLSYLILILITPPLNIEKTSYTNMSSVGGCTIKKSAFVVGYTGEIGKELVKAALASDCFSQLVLIGRRNIKYEDDGLNKLEQRMIDFDKLEEHSDAFKGFQVGICCMGTTRGKSGVEGFQKVDHDYIMGVAKLAKGGGCSEYHLVSSSGANANSSFLYPKVKGQVEEETKALNFAKLFIYRPKVLLCNREESRFAERVFVNLIKPITWLSPTILSVPTTMVAKAIVAKVTSDETGDGNSAILVDNVEIHRLGK